jgi:hypothetical protein
MWSFGVTDDGGVNGDTDVASEGSPRLTGVLLLIARGLLLWIVGPTVAVCWLLGLPLWRRRGVGFGQLLGWADLNLLAGLTRSVFRPVIRQTLPWTPLADAAAVTHRVGILDPV